MLDTDVTLKEAAYFFNVRKDVPRGWVERYHIGPSGRRGRTNLYRLGDLVEAERRSRTANAGRNRS